MTNIKLRDDEWTKIREFLSNELHAYVGNESKCRRFLEAVLWMSRSGAQWRLLPAAYGYWNRVYKRFARWCDTGIWERMLAYFANGADMQHGLLDSPIVRAHPCAAGAQKKR